MDERPPAQRWLRRISSSLATLVLTYVVLAYVVAPLLWLHYEHYPPLETAPRTATTAQGTSADALNVGFVGSQTELIRALTAAGWMPADQRTVSSSVGIVARAHRSQPDPAAPASALYLWGRQQDLTFEQPVGPSADQRRRVRLWQAPALEVDGRPLWLGTATFERSPGPSERTGQMSRQIAPDIDAERDALIDAVAQADQVLRIFQTTGVGTTLRGFNGDGDWYYTDGELSVAVLVIDNNPRAAPPERLANPPAVMLKDRAWSWLRRRLPSR